MDITEILANYKIDDPFKKYSGELLEVYESGKKEKLLTKKNAEIGLLVLNRFPKIKFQKNRWNAIDPIEFESERYKKLKQLIPESGWKTDELKNLLKYFFGEEKAAYVAHAWDKIRFEMYQTGYQRRSFRAPENRDLYFQNQLSFLISAIPQTFFWGHYPKYERQFFDLELAEQIRYSNYFAGNSLFRIWSAAIDLGNENVFQLMEDVIFNKDEIGKVSREIIKALLNSEKKEAWQLVEKLLLAAQRQEGLRQTILEALDETSVGALGFMIDVIVKNKLARFSSVVRAVDVWAGLGWESEREKTVNTFLEKAHEFLQNPNEIPEAVKSENNADVYMALWSQGVSDVEKTLPFLSELYENGNAEKRALAVKFASETANENLDMPIYYKALGDSDLMVLAWALSSIKNLLYGHASRYRTSKKFPDLFEKLHAVVQKTETKEKTFEGKIFSWTRIVFSRNDALSAMIDLIGDDEERLETVLTYFDEMSVDLRQKLTRHILKDYASYSWNEKNKLPEITDFQRDFAFRILSDRGEFMVNSAFHALNNNEFSDDKIEILQNLLRRKGADFRGKIIALLLRQDETKLTSAIENLLTRGDIEQRLAGLDILLQLKKRDQLKNGAKTLIENFSANKKISKKEEILLDQLNEKDEDKKDFSAENGYGIFDADKSVSPIVEPKIDSNNIFEKRYSKNKYAFSVSFGKVKKELEKLAQVYLENKDYEYDAENYDGSVTTFLLGNTFLNKKYRSNIESEKTDYNNYPLAEVWEKWFQDSTLDAADLEIINSAVKPTFKDLIPAYDEIIPKEFKKRYQYNNPVLQIIHALQTIHPFEEKQEFLLGGAEHIFASLDETTLKKKSENLSYQNYSFNSGNGWQANRSYNSFYSEINAEKVADESVERFWNLAHWRQFSGREENAPFNIPPLMTFCRAFEKGLIGEDEMMRGLMTAENLRVLSSKKIGKNHFDYFERFPFLEPMFEKVREHVLDIELKRGDSPTSVTSFAASLQKIYGVKRLVEILVGLGKTPLNRGYSYYYGNTEMNRQRMFSQLLKACFPLGTDTQKDFNALVKEAKIGEKQLIETAVYAPQWQKFVSTFLNWKGLDSAIWWMHAHTKIAGYREQSAESESEIAKYSAVDLQDFKAGAVDKNWFDAAYKEIGKKRWEIIYDAAKYISDGNGHRRARLYADVLSGKTKIKEITNKVRQKRDQDYLRMFGLAPLSKKNPERDVLSRYEQLQKFRKESRQFGAQKQASEALAVRIGMENLARNAGFADPVRLTWAMETRQVQEILSNETEAKFGDCVVKLVIDEEGKADIVVSKGDKVLKAIPPKFKKDKKILELNEYKKTLREQLRRSRIGLEDAMIRGDEFDFVELQTIFSHPVISKHLEKLVFVSEKDHGFFREDALVSAKNETTKLSEKNRIRIAHCVDLYESNEWDDYQKFCFDEKLKQPFKQIFREFYAPTDDELKEKSVSRRYAGHQIQPQKTVALLKTRGWKVDYEEGLQKVFHKEGFAAKMYALADWFSPADVESPTLETVEFHSLKNYKNIPFEEIDARIFSEVMRDIDLVVSVAHAGGVDPEASHSTVEMRSVLLRETLRLYKLENVEIKGNHAKIKGKMGEYSVHLGSAVVHKMPGKYLSILPVQSQHRGRIFLPFADDDPKSAELMSKVLLLARDNEIQDPTILRQLTG